MINNFNDFLDEFVNKDILKLFTCGSVDDGKSTLIGRLLHDSQALFEDHLHTLKSDSKKVGTQGDEIDFALLTDGLMSEREQGITIDVAYRYFFTDKRKFIIADTPGHEQYTRNMATGASGADLAIILVDATKGVLTQTKRHLYIVSLLGIKHILVAINKMDLVDYSQERFESIKRDFESVAKSLPNHADIEFIHIPISALAGESVVKKSECMEWYKGSSLMDMLNDIKIESPSHNAKDFRFPVQYVNRPNPNFRGYCGTIASGSLKVGDEITVLPSGKSTKVKSIILPAIKEKDSTTEMADAGMSITLTTVDEVDISRGDMIVHTHAIPRVSNSLKVMVVWMSDAIMTPETSYLIKSSATTVGGYFEHINYRFDINNYEKVWVNHLQLNDIASCKLVLNSSIVVDPYKKNRTTGSFIIIDRLTNNTVGAGMIVDVSRREQDMVPPTQREYTEAEIELNAYIRKNFPEWGCKAI